MTAPSPELVDALWDSLVEERRPRAPRPVRNWRDEEDLPPPTLIQLRKRMRSYLGWAFDRRPESRDVKDKPSLRSALEGASPILVERLEALLETIKGLEAMPLEDFRWTTREEGFPEEGQAVIYYFQVVGTHPGRYAGRDDSEHGGGLDVFVGDFGGFLGGDVTHWILRP